MAIDDNTQLAGNVTIQPMGADTYVSPETPALENNLVGGQEPPTERPESELISIGPDAPSKPPVSQEAAERRVFKAKFGTPITKTAEELYASFTNGEEDAERSMSAAAIDNKRNIEIQKQLSKFSSELNRPLADKDISFVSGLVRASQEKTDPKSVYEEYYGKAVMDQIEFNKLTYGDNAFDAAENYNPDFVAKVKDAGAQITSKREYLLKHKEEAEAEAQSQSWVGWGLDTLKSVDPTYMDRKLRGNVKGVGAFQGGLLGENLEEQAVKLLSKPFKEFTNELDEVMSMLKRDNPSMAKTFIDAMLGQTDSEKFANSYMSVFNLAGGVEIGAIAKGMMTKAVAGKLVTRDMMTGKVLSEVPIGEAEKAVKDTVATVANVAGQPGVTKADIVAATGNIEEAAVQRVAKGLAESGNTSTKRAVKDLPTFMQSSAEKIRDNVGNGGQSLARQIEDRMMTTVNTFIKQVQDVIKVERLPEALANEKVVRDYRDYLRSQTPAISNAILNISDFKKNPISNTYTVDLIIGQPQGGLFSSANIAKTFAKNHGLSQYPIEKKGHGYYIRVEKPVNETSHIIRDYLLSTKDSVQPKGWANSFRAWLQTPEETLSMDQNMNRKAATHGPKVLSNLAKEYAKEIDQIKRGVIKTDPVTGESITLGSRLVLGGRKKRWEEWQRALANGSEAIDPSTQQKGYFFKSIGELEDFYQRSFKRLPDEVETRGYFAATNIIEMDGIMRDILNVRNKSRLGVEQHRFFTKDADGKKLESAYFEGARKDNFPGGDGIIMLVENRFGKERLVTSNSIGAREIKALKDAIARGEKMIIEIYDPEKNPFNGFGKVKTERVQYIVADAFETKPIDWNQVGRRGGGHIEYEYDWYIKQPKVVIQTIGRNVAAWYNGDSTIMAAEIRALGKDAATKLDTVRKMLLAKDSKGAKAYAANNLDIEWKELSSWFSKHKVDGVEVPARLSLTEPIMLVKRGSKTIDIDDSVEKFYTQRRNPIKFMDGTKQDSMARQHQIEYTQERDAYEMFEMSNTGTQQRPFYTPVDAKVVDPLTMMNRAMERITNSYFMDDYKTFSVEHWLRDAKQYFKEPGKLQYTPNYFFEKPDFRKDMPIEERSRLEAARMQIKQLIGVPSKVDAVLHSAAQNLADAMYTKFGQRGYELTPTWAITGITKVPDYMRAAAFHAKLGVFNPAQLLVQMQTFANIIALGGRDGVTGTYGAFLTQLARQTTNEDIMKGLDDMATKLHIPGITKHYKPGEWLEAHREMTNTGFGHVGGEYAALDYMKGPEVSSTKLGRFLDAGTFFFKEGERHTRYGAWHTAFKEWRDINPVKKIDDASRREILQRADLLTANMTRASNSSLHRGVMSIPTQFLAYQLRVAELFFGNRLDWKDRARMLAWNAGLYGIPVSVGLTGFPAADMIRTAALEQGYVVGEKWHTTLMMEGFPSLFAGLITGVNPNIGGRYGSGGFEWTREILNSDNPWWKTVGGASWSTLSGTWEKTDGFMAAMGSLIRGDTDKFPIKPVDFVDVLREVTTVNSAWRGIAAVNTGRWMSKKEGYIDDVSPLQAVFQSLTGLQSQQADDIHLLAMSKKSQNDFEKWVGEKAIKEFRRGLRAVKDDPGSEKQYMIRANTYLTVGGFPENKRAAIFAKAIKDYEPMTQSIYWDFYLKNTPKGAEKVRSDAYISIKSLQKERKGQ